MNEHRRQILDMLASGKITADEAERLLSALESTPQHATGDVKPSPRYLHVVVDKDGDGDARGKKVDIRVPLQFLRAGVRLANVLPGDARERVNEALRRKGVAFDVGNLKPENVDALIEQLNDISFDIDNARGHATVKMYCE
jgi:hypothetical protein